MFDVSPRQPLRAALMSLVLPGYGQFYNGELDKAVWLFLAFAFLCVPGMALVGLYLPPAWTMPALGVSVVAALGTWGYAVVDAWRGARARPDYLPRPWQTGAAYAVAFLVCNGLALPLLVDTVRSRQMESFSIPSASMAPSVLRGDILFADKRYNCPGCKQQIRRGDVAVFTYPNDRTRLYIKRIVGLPGDRVETRGAAVWVNGVALSTDPVMSGAVTETLDGRRWQVLRGGTGSTRAPEEAPPDVVLTVPPGQVFVLGDNRDATTDSRRFGPVPMADVAGRARQVWWSSGPEGVRWARLGAVVE